MVPILSRRRTRDALVAGGLWLAISLLGGAGCASCETAPVTGYEHAIDEAMAAQLGRVGLGPGDVFDVTVWNEPTMTGAFRVGPDGTIHFPLVGVVAVDGLTPNECADLLRRKLQEGFLREPNVSVYVKELNSKKVFVLGEVARPGTFPFAPNMTIVEALSVAGGFTAAANRNNVIVTRHGEAGEQRVRLPVEKITRGEAPNYGLRPGDIIFVPDRLL
jgi:protein involved in polysaccharide export with SLBB domain